MQIGSLIYIYLLPPFSSWAHTVDADAVLQQSTGAISMVTWTDVVLRLRLLISRSIATITLSTVQLGHRAADQLAGLIMRHIL